MIREPFISTIFAKSYYLVRDYKNMSVKDGKYLMAGDFRDLEKKYFFRIVNSTFKFDDTLENTFNSNLFIEEMDNLIKNYNYNPSLLRDYKLFILTK